MTATCMHSSRLRGTPVRGRSLTRRPLTHAGAKRLTCGTTSPSVGARWDRATAGDGWVKDPGGLAQPAPAASCRSGTEPLEAFS